MYRTLAAIVFLVLGACQSTPTESPMLPGADPAQLADEDAPVDRIVSIIPSATELLFALGVGERVVARSSHCNFPPEALELPSIGSGLDPDIERIIALSPDLVVASRVQEGLAALQSLRAAGIEIMVIPDQSIADVFEALELLGERLDVVERARERRGGLDLALDAARPDDAPNPAPRVLVVVGTDPTYAAGAGSFVADLIEIAGGVAVPPGDWVNLDDESIVALAPQVIVQSARDEAELAHWSRFGDAVPAVREQRVCIVEPDLVARPGPRVALAALAIRDCILR